MGQHSYEKVKKILKQSHYGPKLRLIDHRDKNLNLTKSVSNVQKVRFLNFRAFFFINSKQKRCEISKFKNVDCVKIHVNVDDFID